MPDENEALTPSEIKILKELAVSSQRTKWLVQGVRQVAVWVTALGAAWLMVKGFLSDPSLWSGK